MKHKLRKELLQVRNQLSKEEIREHSRMVCEQLLPYLKGTVGIYHSIDSEVCVDELIKLAHVHFAIPKTKKDHMIDFYAIDEFLTYKNGSYGILEPKEGTLVDKIDVLVIPLVAFDESCNRLGHGLGYYDRYLAHFEGLKIGVAHECQKVENIYPQPHDISLDMIVTEEKIYRK